MTIPFPNESDAWNTVMLDGFEVPGICHVEVDLEMEIDVQKAKGNNGAKTTRQGENPASVNINVTMLTSDDLQAWRLLQSAIRGRPKKGEAGSAVSIEHPKTALYGISAVHVRKIVDRSGANGTGGRYEVQLQCVEFFPGNAGKSGATATKTESKLEARDQVLADNIPDQPLPSSNATDP